MAKKVNAQRAEARRLFEQNGLRLKDIAEELDVKYSTIRTWKIRDKWEKGNNKATYRFSKNKKENQFVDVLEWEFEEFFCKQVKKVGGRTYKFTSPGCPGVPDRIVMFSNSKIAFVELKRPNGKGHLSEVQKKEIDILELLGQKVFVLDSYNKVDEVINQIKYGN